MASPISTPTSGCCHRMEVYLLLRLPTVVAAAEPPVQHSSLLVGASVLPYQAVEDANLPAPEVAPDRSTFQREPTDCHKHPLPPSHIRVWVLAGVQDLWLPVVMHQHLRRISRFLHRTAANRIIAWTTTSSRLTRLIGPKKTHTFSVTLLLNKLDKGIALKSMRQAEDRFYRSKETCSRKFDKVLRSVNNLAAHIIRPVDPEFRTVHPRLQSARFSPYFDNCIGAIDGTHIPVEVPANQVVQHMGRKGYTTQNVLAVCDFDMRFTFVVVGWPGSVHDMRVFKNAIDKYGDKFPHPPPGKFYLVDSGYPNRPGYLAPYRGMKYHLAEFHQGPMPRGKKVVFNYAHSSLRNVIERSFAVLKNKWRILKHLPSYPMHKQSKIVIACMALHNFIRDSSMADEDFDMCDHDENYVPLDEEGSQPYQGNGSSTRFVDEGQDMNQFRDWIADGLFARS